MFEEIANFCKIRKWVIWHLQEVSSHCAVYHVVYDVFDERIFWMYCCWCFCWHCCNGCRRSR